MTPSLYEPQKTPENASRNSWGCSDPSVVPSDEAPDRVKELWQLHGHPHSKRYSNPDLISLSALVRHNGVVNADRTAFYYPIVNEPKTPFQSMSWKEFDNITDSISSLYASALHEELKASNVSQCQPTVGLIGQGVNVHYFCTQLALQKLGVRVLLLAESNAVKALHHLLEICNACAVVVDSRNTSVDTNGLRKITMIEELSHAPSSKVADIEEVRFQDFGDVWERHSFIVHSSGSTGMPKPIIHTNRSLMLIARMYRLFQEFEITNWLLLFPL